MLSERNKIKDTHLKNRPQPSGQPEAIYFALGIEGSSGKASPVTTALRSRRNTQHALSLPPSTTTQELQNTYSVSLGSPHVSFGISLAAHLSLCMNSLSFQTEQV